MYSKYVFDIFGELQEWVETIFLNFCLVGFRLFGVWRFLLWDSKCNKILFLLSIPSVALFPECLTSTSTSKTNK